METKVFTKEAFNLVLDLSRKGKKYKDISIVLNERGYTTKIGRPFNPGNLSQTMNKHGYLTRKKRRKTSVVIKATPKIKDVKYLNANLADNTLELMATTLPDNIKAHLLGCTINQFYKS